MLQIVQTIGHDDAVFLHQRHHVGNGTHRHHIGIFLQQIGDGPILFQGANDLKGHAYTGQFPEGILAVHTPGVDHSHRVGQFFFALVMVGDDEPQAQLLGKNSLFLGGDAAVHRDEQTAAVIVQALDGRYVQAIALFQAVGDVIGAIGTHLLQILDHDAGGSDAVHIIIAVNGDFFFVFDGPANFSHCLVHVLQQEGIVDPLQRVGHEGLCFLPGIKATGCQYTSRKPAEPKLPGHTFRAGIMIGCKQPFFLFHSALQIYIFITVHYNKPTGLLQVISVKNAVLEKKFQFLLGR